MDNLTAKPVVIETEGVFALRCNQAVAVLPYTLLLNGEIDKIGIVTEKNPHFPGRKHTGIVMGTLEGEDTSLLQRAKAELSEEAGIQAEENDRWSYIGELITSKMIPEPIYCFAVNVTDLPLTKPNGDGSKGEEGITFKLQELNSALKVNDAALHFCFFTLFREIYKDQF